MWWSVLIFAFYAVSAINPQFIPLISNHRQWFDFLKFWGLKNERTGGEDSKWNMSRIFKQGSFWLTDCGLIFLHEIIWIIDKISKDEKGSFISLRLRETSSIKKRRFNPGTPIISKTGLKLRNQVIIRLSDIGNPKFYIWISDSKIKIYSL